MRKNILLLFILISSFSFSQKNKENKTVVAKDYFPSAQSWEHKDPSSIGLDSSKINAAIQFAKENEAKLPRNQEIAQAMTFGKEPTVMRSVRWQNAENQQASLSTKDISLQNGVSPIVLI